MGIAPYFRTVLADKLKEWCNTHKNQKTGENYNLYRDGLKIYTTINSKMQQYAEEAVVQHMPVIQKKFKSVLAKEAAAVKLRNLPPRSFPDRKSTISVPPGKFIFVQGDHSDFVPSLNQPVREVCDMRGHAPRIRGE